MDLEEIVRLLGTYFEDEGQTIERENGAEARSMVEGMVDLLEEQLEAETPFAALWREFKETPRETEAELIGALEVLEESNPTLTERLGAFSEGFDYGVENNQPAVRSDMLGEETSDPYTAATIQNDSPINAAGDEGNYADERERFNEDEIDEQNFRYPVWPDYIDEANTYLVGDRGDDQSTAPIMYFGEGGSDNADYSALPEEEIPVTGEDVEDSNDDPDDIADSAGV